MSPLGARFQRFDPQAGQRSENIFDPGLWSRATGLFGFSAELRVTSGSVEVSFEALETGQESARLRACDTEHAPQYLKFSSSDTAVLPVIVNTTKDARYQLTFGTLQEARIPDTRVAFLIQGASAEVITRVSNLYQGFTDLESDQNAGADSRLFFDTGRLNPRPLRNRVSVEGVHVLAGSRGSFPRRAAYEISYGRLTSQECTHLCILEADHDPLPDLFLRALMLSRFMPRDRFFHHPGMSSSWPAALFDLRCIYEVGLPRADLRDYLYRLVQDGTRRSVTPETLQETPASLRPPLSKRIRQHLSVPHPRSPNGRLSRLQRDLFECRRQQAHSNRMMLSLLKNRHKGKRAVVIGNGPSLEIADLDRLKTEITFASNKIYLAYGQTKWRPTYYSVEDSLVIQNNQRAIADLDGSIKIFPDTVRAFGFTDGKAIYPRLLPPKSFQEPLADPDFPGFSDDLCQGLCWGSTITYSQIQMAIHMGCNEIILIGVDHSYTLPKIKEGNIYHYEGEQNHFHPEYRTAGEKWHQPNLEVLEVSYRKARDFCAARDIRILNASRKTCLDVFERSDFDTLFPPKEKRDDTQHF